MLRHLQLMAGKPCQHEQVIAEAVEIFYYDGLYKYRVFLHVHAASFGPPAYTAGNVRGGNGEMPAGQDK